MSRFVDDHPFFSEPSGAPQSLAILLNRLGVEFESDQTQREAIAKWLRSNTPVPRLAEELRKRRLLIA